MQNFVLKLVSNTPFFALAIMVSMLQVSTQSLAGLSCIAGFPSVLQDRLVGFNAESV